MSRQPTAPAELGDAVIDSIDFVRRGAKLAGEVPLARLGRLADMLVEDSGSLQFELAGEHDDEGDPCLRLKLAGVLRLRCQRCLGAMDWPLAIDSVLRIVPAGSLAVREVDAGDGEEGGVGEEPDAIEADKELAVLPLIEDEVLLSLPIAPRHERCALPLGSGREAAPSPFAVLAQLKKH